MAIGISCSVVVAVHPLGVLLRRQMPTVRILRRSGSSVWFLTCELLFRHGKVLIDRKHRSASGMPSEPLAAHVTSYLLETSLASAAHHFIIQDTETGQNRLVLWLFNPLVRLSADALSLPIEVCKIFYSIAEDGRAISDLAAEALIGNASYETHSMPSHLCTSLAMLLQQSTAIYPSSQQRFAGWTVGWLQHSSFRP